MNCCLDEVASCGLLCPLPTISCQYFFSTCKQMPQKYIRTAQRVYKSRIFIHVAKLNKPDTRT